MMERLIARLFDAALLLVMLATPAALGAYLGPKLAEDLALSTAAAAAISAVTTALLCPVVVLAWSGLRGRGKADTSFRGVSGAGGHTRFS